MPGHRRETYDEDEDRLHLQGLLCTFLGDCAFYQPARRPLPEADLRRGAEVVPKRPGLLHPSPRKVWLVCR